MESEKEEQSIGRRVKDAVNNIIGPEEVELSEIKEEVWLELANLYYKYEDETQKRAFREVMYEICDKISEGEWNSVYRKLYHLGQLEKTL